MFRKTINIIISLAVSFALFYFLLRDLPLSNITRNILNTKWGYTALAFLAYLLCNYFRAYRYELLLNKKILRQKLIPIVFLQNFFNSILPFRVGELSYVLLVRNHQNIEIGENLSSLLGSRILDLVSALGFFVLSLFFISAHIEIKLVFSAIAVLVVGVLLLFFLIFGEQLLSRFKPPVFLSQKFPRLAGFLSSVANGFFEFRKRHIMFRACLLSLMIMGTTFLMGYFLFQSASIQLSFWSAVFVYTLPLLLSLTPFYGFGGIGGYEGSVGLGLMLLGIGREAAISGAILLHLQELFFLGILAILGFLWLRHYHDEYE